MLLLQDIDFLIGDIRRVIVNNIIYQYKVTVNPLFVDYY